MYQITTSSYMTIAMIVLYLQATFANLSPEELKKRQEYLKEQREKLTAMKQKVRKSQDVNC